MRTENYVRLRGRLGASPVFRVAANKVTVATFSVATNRKANTRDSADNTTDWHRVVMFGKMADDARGTLDKGSAVLVEGELRTRKWKDDEGNDREVTEIAASECSLLTPLGKPDKKPHDA